MKAQPPTLNTLLVLFVNTLFSPKQRDDSLLAGEVSELTHKPFRPRRHQMLH